MGRSPPMLFAYDKSWEQIEGMLEKAIKEQNKHFVAMQSCKKSERMYYMRQYKGLQGVINSLKWVLGEKRMTEDEVLGRVN